MQKTIGRAVTTEPCRPGPIRLPTGCWYVYILECEDGTLYTGVTKDPKRRLIEHQAGGCRYTRSRRGVRMLRTRRCMSKVRAYQYEWKLKRATRQQKFDWCGKRWEPQSESRRLSA